MTLIIYTIYAFSCAVWVFADARKKKAPAGWALVVLIAPVTVLQHLHTHHGERFHRLAGVFAASLILLAGVEFGAMYIVKITGRPKGSVEEGLYLRKKKVTRSLRNLSDSLVKLEKRSRSISKTGTMELGVTLIDDVFKNLRKNDDDIERLVYYVEAYRDRIAAGRLGDYIRLGEYFEWRKKLGFNESLNEYLVDFRRLLTYSIDHMGAIKTGDQQAKKTYETLYFQYRLSVRKRNEVTHKSLKLRADILRKHPHLENMIPDKDRPESLSIWVQK